MKNENYKKIQNFSDACIAVGITETMFYQKHIGLSTYLINVAKLEIINKAINGDWSPNWDDNNEYKYYPHFNMSVSSGFGFSVTYYYYDSSISSVGSRLCYESKEQSNYTANTFTDIYKAVYLIDKNEPPLKEFYTPENSDLETEESKKELNNTPSLGLIQLYDDDGDYIAPNNKKGMVLVENLFNGIKFKNPDLSDKHLGIMLFNLKKYNKIIEQIVNNDNCFVTKSPIFKLNKKTYSVESQKMTIENLEKMINSENKICIYKIDEYFSIDEYLENTEIMVRYVILKTDIEDKNKLEGGIKETLKKINEKIKESDDYLIEIKDSMLANEISLLNTTIKTHKENINLLEEKIELLKYSNADSINRTNEQYKSLGIKEI